MSTRQDPSMRKYFQLDVSSSNQYLPIPINQSQAYGHPELVLTESKNPSLHLYKLSIYPVRARLRMLQVDVIPSGVLVIASILGLSDGHMYPALFLRVEDPPAFVVIDLVLLVALDQIQQAVTAFEGLLGFLMGKAIGVLRLSCQVNVWFHFIIRLY